MTALVISIKSIIESKLVITIIELLAVILDPITEFFLRNPWLLVLIFLSLNAFVVLDYISKFGLLIESIISIFYGIIIIIAITLSLPLSESISYYYLISKENKNRNHKVTKYILSYDFINKKEYLLNAKFWV